MVDVFDGDDYTPDFADIGNVVDDVRSFFLSSDHWIYASRGTPTQIGPNSVYHVGQLEVLFEDKHFHFRTNLAVRRLREEGFLRTEQVAYQGGTATIVWRPQVRYTRRLIAEHIRLIEEYSSEGLNRATGNYAETLTLLGLSQLGLKLLSRSTRQYRDLEWTETDHDLDFILEANGVGYGVEVKNTWVYLPANELEVKLKICQHLGLRPLFVARHRHSGQWQSVKQAGGILYIFKSKILPPGQDELAGRIWRQMRLPVAVWNDWPPHFYPTMQSLLGQLS